ncbi:SGNH/GDSL hydrolase family protein [Defluviimonas sp. SAOS-178_SWC]|uniref:SGNH/GDSL hydrolase family protein n=1 Tax=Defluviimonas sp. SAOS-178_SWC TaxID=3121287 RepID=UPI0032219A46
MMAISAISLAGCGEAVTHNSDARILALGDSMFAWNKLSNNAVPDVLESNLGEEVVDRSVIGARYLYGLSISGAAGLNISKQYRSGDWDWVVINGGGNDLWFGCGCMACEQTIERLISSDGQTGKIPALVSKIRHEDAKVVYVGYLHSPGAYSIIDHCKSYDIEFERRVANLAARTDDFYYLGASDVVPEGDLSFHSIDRIHPSIKGSKALAAMIADLIRAISI